jgi:type IV pilus assembly protein PilW
MASSVSLVLRPRAWQRGLGLIEILVAMALGLVLTAVVIQLFVSQKQSYRTEEGVSRIQENARYALELLEKEIRMAGYMGCGNLSTLKDCLNPNTLFNLDWKTPIQGYDALTATAWNTAIAPTGLSLGSGTGEQVRGGTDILVIRRVQDRGVEVAQAMPNVSADIKVTPSATPLIEDREILIIADCTKSALFQVTNYTPISGNVVHNQGASPVPGNATKLLSNSIPYDTDAELLRLQTLIFYIGTDPQGRPALKLRRFGNTTAAAAPSEVLVSDVENLQLLFGIDTDATADGLANRYVAAGVVNPVTDPRVRPDWQDVVSVRLALLMQSPEEARSEANTASYALLDQTVSASSTIAHAGDRRIRHVVTTTANLRN